MAFLSAFSSNIGKRILLFGLRHIDILDKDPADFVSVDVGKKTTLEFRDVGLHVKKLVSLLHLKLPPELHLSKARASLLRVTFLLELGVPQIIIEIDGVQVHARLAEDTESLSKAQAKSSQSRTQPQATSPLRRRAKSPPPDDDSSDLSSDEDEGDLPTLDDLAQSFIREKPKEEIQELEEALNSKSEYLQQSMASSDSEEEAQEGMGAGLGLPGVLRNILNTALDRLQIIATNVELRMEDRLSADVSSESDHNSPASSVRFHVERIAVDSVTTQEPDVDITSSTKLNAEDLPRIGKRRMRIQNVCAKLISDAENFISHSRISRASSPADTRSESSFSRKPESDIESRQASPTASRSRITIDREGPPPQASIQALRDDVQTPIPAKAQEEEHKPLSASVVTTDEDRFADAGSDDESDLDMAHSLASHSRNPLDQQEMNASSMLNDEGLLEYAADNNMFDSQIEPSTGHSPLLGQSDHWGGDGTNSSYIPRESPRLSTPALDSDSSSDIEHSLGSLAGGEPLSQSRNSGDAHNSTDNLGAALDACETGVEVDDGGTDPQPSHPSPDEDLAESKLFTHDDAESMYMSAMSAAPLVGSHGPAIPGGWDSSSSASSQAASSDSSAPIPPSMIAGSILGALREHEDGSATPRPGSRQSQPATRSYPPRTTGSQGAQSAPTEASNAEDKVAKLFLAVDEITVWFPLEIGEEQEGNDHTQDPSTIDEGLSFVASNVGQDSVFQEMPGSFSNYAHSSAYRKKPSIDLSKPSKRQSDLQPTAQMKSAEGMKKKDLSATVSAVVGSVVAHVDFATGRILFKILERLTKALTTGNDNSAKTVQKDSQPASRASIELTIKHLGIAWLQQLMSESLSEGGSGRDRLEVQPMDAILKLNLTSVYAGSQTATGHSSGKLSIGKFVLASLDQEILSFHRASRSRRSVTSSNIQEQLRNDIEITYQQKHERRLQVSTRPIKMTFDMQKLDESLSTFGGFSGVLELSNSITSNASLVSPSTPTSKPRSRGVHFGDNPPPPTPSTPSSSSSLKVDIHAGDVFFALKGKSCAMQVQTTSVKMAIREKATRIKISELHLSGPYTHTTNDGAPLLVEIRDLETTFVFEPEEQDLAKLISLITPSKDPYENDEDILVDTLLRQRRKGSVIRVQLGSVAVRMSDLAELTTLEALGREMAKLSKVTKYLPDDDRPGILALASVQKFNANVRVNDRLGDISLAAQNTSLAHVGLPSLMALEVGHLLISRADEILVHDVVPLRQHDQLPMVMARMIGDEMEPIIKVKLFNFCAEYHVTTVMAALGISDDGTFDDIAMGIASSVATITRGSSPKPLSRQTSETSSPSGAKPNPFRLDLLLRSCAIGLNPRKIASKGLFVLTDARFEGTMSKKDQFSMTVQLRKASIHAIDDVSRLDEHSMPPAPPSSTGASLGHRQLLDLQHSGFVSLSSISAAKVVVRMIGDGKDQPQIVDVEFKNELFVLESCADSTQTLIAILGGLQPPMPPSTAERYRTVVPLQRMIESFTGDALPAPERTEDDDFMENADLVTDEVPTNLEYVGSFYNSQSLPTEEDLGDSMLGEDDLDALATPPVTRQRGERPLLESFQEHYEVGEGGSGDFDFDENYFKDSDSDHKGKARKWDSAQNKYELSNEFKTPDAPLKVRVRDVNIVWNLYDGYDWPRTREIISQAVEDVEARAEERRKKPREEEQDEDFVEEDFLFNSVWVGIPVKDEKGTLARKINHAIDDDMTSETGSYAPSTATRSTSATVRPGSATKSKRKRLRLERSKRKKIAFELSGVAVDFIVFPPGTGETVSSVNVRVRDFEIYDHVPSSTWRKFATSMIDRTQREMDRPMINLELLTVKPVSDLAASELVLQVTVLPLRLHVDQDALDFITRFFEFKDDSAPDSTGSKAEEPFIQRLEVNTVQIKLDYKPKRVDYAGLRSGHTTEFMNFLILDEADIILRHAILYGITSFDKLHKTLNDVWMPDVKRNQLPGVLSGLAAVRPIVNVGHAVSDLVVVPMREYKKDGRILRSLQKGVFAFGRNTTSGVARLGAKVAIGTQNLLEGAETFLNPQSSSPRSGANIHDWDDLGPAADPSEDEPRAVSNYANQPIGVKEGIRSAARLLERDLLTTKDAIIALPGEVMEEGTGVGMAKALGRKAPTIILRPGLGVAKAVSNTLLGVGNALDKDARRKIEDKYKNY